MPFLHYNEESFLRPPWFGISMASKRISVDLPDELYQRLKLLCYTEDLKLGDTIRKCVEDYCNDKEAHMIKIVDNRSISK